MGEGGTLAPDREGGEGMRNTVLFEMLILVVAINLIADNSTLLIQILGGFAVAVYVLLTNTGRKVG